MNRSLDASASSANGDAPAGRGLRLWARALRVLLWLLAGLWGVFILTWLVLQAWIVPRIDTWRPDLERWATHAVGIPVTIGAIRAIEGPTLAGVLPPLVPSFELSDVRLHDANGRSALQLPLVRAAVSVQSLWHGGFEQLRIDSPSVDVRRRADGRVEIAGIDVSGDGGGNHAAADWFFEQPEFVVRGGTVRWIDERRQQPPVLLRDLDFVARNGARSHELRLDATPEPEWGERFSLRGRLREPLLRLPLKAPAGQAPWDNWSGELYAEFARADVSRLRAHLDLSDSGVDVRSGEGALRAWARVQQGQVQGLTLDMALQDLDLQLAPDLPDLALAQARGRLEAQWSDRGMSLGSDDLAFTTREGLDWAGARVRVEHTLARERQGARTVVQAQAVDLQTVAAIAERLPLPADARDWLARLQPRGRLDTLDLTWQARGSGPMAEHVVARARGRVSGLALAGEPSGKRSRSGRFPLPGRPGIEGADVDFDLDENGGQASVALREGAFIFPDVFEEPRIALDRFDGRVRWTVKGDRLDIQLDQATLANDHAEGTLQARWHTGDPAAQPAQPRLPGVLDLSAQLTRADGTAVHRYLPMVVPESARRYVREAARAGGSRQASFRVQGLVDDIPFDEPHHSSGTFRIEAALEGVDFDYLPAVLQDEGEAHWPGVRNASARFVLDRGSLQISEVRGGVDGAPGVALDGGVDIENLAHDARVRVRVHGKGPADELLGFVQRSPVNTFTEGALASAQASGPGETTVQIDLPLKHLKDSRVSGKVRLDGTDLRLMPGTPLLARTRATLDFTDQGFAFTGARSQVLGGELLFDGSLRSEAPGRTVARFRGSGTASAAGLREGGFGPVSNLFAHASGSARYNATLGFRGGAPELRIDSSLQGLALSLPAPLSKPAEAAWPLRLESAVQGLQGDKAVSDRITLQLGPAAQPLVDLIAERDLRGESARLVRGGLAVGQAAGERAVLPPQGLHARLRVGELDLDAWRALLRDSGTEATAVLGEGLPLAVSLHADAALVDGRRFQRVVVGASREGPVWRANVDANELNGYVEFRPAGPAGAGSIRARLARLTLSPAAPREVDALLQQPGSVPALDIAVDDLQWDGRSLGRVEIDAVNRGGPTRVGEWRLNALRATLPEARLSASGNWAPLGGGEGGQRRTALQFRLDVDDSGALLNRFGKEGLVRGGKGRLEGQIGWLGTPFGIHYPTLAGNLKLDVARGQFLKADPGAGRLLGVLSLQALPRRLALDFRDVFSEGFAFDFVRGDARIEQGVIHSNNLQMKGVNAAVLMEGSADLARETQDLKVVVVPELNAGTASLIATAINPAVGLGSFLAQFLLRQPLQSAATQEFRVSGGWADPQVEKVARPTPAPTPGTTLQ
ncbi:MAG: TIGR02099 family protein [Hydrogenophaga sp.]|uniref:YhdP family protein n=1 Tax=Hydrogenophaga sp. TaxID=1904254 RepID=UPI0016A393AA|nr:YhdP family protein [Hydrogenophaga sp.]NIM39776.1 TIGR02099 family protein [Hydrogenophaga sp.]NIN24980.1 TIGR02099 family protein [Hydrogenophaga sp.]NIN29492.1 TIGR02099 family protein [Hydrogenophaga sp.]NIN54015.1 TIGR02099 family protein [Hydrogenophaga sp.]NIO50219.1 TIGR02099 family protein [Hydrogenophaga sp.]